MTQHDLLPDRTPVQSKKVPTSPPRPGESQLDATRRTLRGTGLNASALGAIKAAESSIDRQMRKR
jgi:hypothetical protein